MNYKRFAPIIGKELTWPLLDVLMEEVRKELKAQARKKPRKKKVVAALETEDDGA
jgi:hypothetical protein